MRGDAKMTKTNFAVDDALTRTVGFYVALGLMLLSRFAVAAPGDTTRVSVSSTGQQTNIYLGDSLRPSISPDGRYVAFDSWARDLVEAAPEIQRYVFTHDRQAGVTTLVSSKDGGYLVGNSYRPSVSAGGRYVAFYSNGSLVAGDTNIYYDVYVRDTVNGALSLVSVAPDGGASDDSSYAPSISADGRYVAFESSARNIVAGDAYWSDVFVRDRHTGVTSLLSRAADGGAANGYSDSPAISADGRYVVFRSDASNLVSGDTNSRPDVFVHDLLTGATTLLSRAADGGASNSGAISPSVSADGRYVTFASNATNLVTEGVVVGQYGIYVHDRQTGVTTLLAAGFGSDLPSISSDGRYVAFESGASDLVTGDTNHTIDIFRHDRLTGVTERVSVSSDGAEANGLSSRPSISADGGYVAFDSDASNLVAGDTNGVEDIFVHELDVGVPTSSIGAVILPDLDGNEIGEVAVLRGDAVLEIRDGATGSLSLIHI
jgi:Tol biopolymer transport system component